MRFTIRLECEDGGEPIVVGQIDRVGPLQAGTLGISLKESKSLLASVQEAVVQSQFRAHAAAQRHCDVCGTHRHIKDYHSVRFQTLFGDAALRIPRLQCCACKADACATATVTVEDLADWVSPELRYVQNELAATLPFARSSHFLQMLLPVGRGNAPGTLWRRIQTTGARLDAEITRIEAPALIADAQTENTPALPSATAIGLDSGYVRDCRPGVERHFEIVVGRIINSECEQRSVGFVRTLEDNDEARHRLQQRLHDLGLPAGGLALFSDGDAGLRGLVPEATHILDWFHLTRHLTVIQQILDGSDAISQFPAVIHDRLCKWLTSMKWRLWHGRVAGALQRVASMLFILQRPAVTCKPAATRLRRQAIKLQGYLNSNADSIPNYGLRYRNGQRISTAFVESAVNQLIDKRMSKSQQMRWSPEGAHAVLQVRAEVIDQRLGAAFARWYPGFVAANDPQPLAA